jgi:hypothetical protein
LLIVFRAGDREDQAISDFRVAGLSTATDRDRQHARP